MSLQDHQKNARLHDTIRELETTSISNVANASAYLSRLLQRRALDMPESQREDFFDPRNRTQWLQWMVDQILEDEMYRGAANE